MTGGMTREMTGGMTAPLPASQRIGKDGVQDFPDFLPEAEREAVYGVLKNFRIPSSALYLDLADLKDPAVPDRLAACLPPLLAAFVPSYLRRLLAAAPEGLRRLADGFEFWTTHPTTDPEGQVYLHRDNDERRRADTGEVRTPLMGSVLYMSPSQGLAGGGTLFVTDEEVAAQFPLFANSREEALLALPAGVLAMNQRPGRLLLFQGDLVHGVRPVYAQTREAPRVAFLANLWSSRIGDVPQGLSSLTPEEFQERTRP